MLQIKYLIYLLINIFLSHEPTLITKNALPIFFPFPHFFFQIWGEEMDEWRNEGMVGDEFFFPHFCHQIWEK